MKLRDVSLADKYNLREGYVFMTGVQALVRLPMMQREVDAVAGYNTAGFVSGYPGSPLASLDIQMRSAKSVLAERGIHFQPGLNEDLALTSVWGSQQGEARGDSKYDGVFAYWYGKGAGLDRSGDALRHGNLAGSSPKGGVLVLLGDDHQAESSSVAHYSEYTMVDFMMPVLNPANVDELLKYGLYGIQLSRYAGCWVSMKCTHDVVESAEPVYVQPPEHGYAIPANHTLPPDGLNLRYPDTPLAQENRSHNLKMPAVHAFARANRLDRVVWGKGPKRLGIVTTGKTYYDILEALSDLGIDEREAAELGVHLYKVGMSWPLEPSGVRSFGEGHETLLIVGEKRSLIEAQLKEMLFHDANAPQVVGKTDAQGRTLLPSNGTLPSRLIALTVGRLLRDKGLEGGFLARLDEMDRDEAGKIIPLNPMERRPSFCSGCPHNRSTVVPAGSRGGAGTGCNYMVMWMDRGSVGYSQMGADGANWIGEAPFSKRKHVFQNMGDGTYTHSGLLSIRAAVAANVNITFKILHNGVVAMTGGQPHDFQLSVPVIARQVLAEGVKQVVVVADDPERHAGNGLPSGVDARHRDDIDAIQRDLEKVEGVTVLIYDQMCATEKRRLRKRKLLPEPDKRVFINHAVCEGCGDCGVKSNCVSIVPRETEFGRKRQIDQFSCNKDYSCVEGFCPSFVTVSGGELRRPEAARGFDKDVALPDPVLPDLGRPYNIVLAGVGGTGVITLAAILGMAAHLESKSCTTLDMMGLAQKGGAVTSHVRIATRETPPNGARIADEKADLVLGFDMLALISGEPISTVAYDRTKVLANTNEVMPGDFARQPDLDFPTLASRERIEAAAGRGMVEYVNATSAATAAVGDAIAANTYLLGLAFQRGHIPLSVEAIERAFELNGTAVELNKSAFRAGRLAAIRPVEQVDRAAVTESETQGISELIASRRALLAAYQNEAYADEFENFVRKIEKHEIEHFGEAGDFTYQVAWSLGKLMAYKDEYEVARLYSSGAFKRELRERFEGDLRLNLHLAPPLFARRDPVTGHLKKRAYGSWIFKVFGVLASLRGLRGTPFDIFGYTEERKTERQLIREFQAEIVDLLPRLSTANYAIATSIASLPQAVRGFGHVKEASIEKTGKQRITLHKSLDNASFMHVAAE